jgi:hypothetical protein
MLVNQALPFADWNLFFKLSLPKQLIFLKYKYEARHAAHYNLNPREVEA